MTGTLNQSPTTITDRPLSSTSSLSLATSSAKYSSSLSTRSNVPKINKSSSSVCSHLLSTWMVGETDRLKVDGTLTVLWSIKTCERSSKNFYEVTSVPEMHVHILKIGVNMITIPERKYMRNVSLIDITYCSSIQVTIEIKNFQNNVNSHL